MYICWFLIVVGILIIVASLCAKDDGFLGLGVICILFFSWFAPLAIGTWFSPERSEYTEVIVVKRTAEILCIKDNSNISGTMSLFGGSINETMYYYYYAQESDGAIVLKNIRVASAKLYEDAPEDTGYILEIWSTFADIKHSHWYFITGKPFDSLNQREIHIPLGTVSRQFILDAE